MKPSFVFITLACAASPAFALLGTIIGALQDITQAIVYLNNIVDAFEGDFAAIEAAAEQLEAAIGVAIDRVESIGELAFNELLELKDYVERVAAAGEALLETLLGQRSAFEAAGVCDPLETRMKSISSQAGSLIDVVLAAAPDSVDGIADTMASSVTGTFNKAVQDFSAGQCVDKTDSTGSDSDSESDDESDSGDNDQEDQGWFDWLPGVGDDSSSSFVPLPSATPTPSSDFPWIDFPIGSDSPTVTVTVTQAGVDCGVPVVTPPPASSYPSYPAPSSSVVPPTSSIPVAAAPGRLSAGTGAGVLAGLAAVAVML